MPIHSLHTASIPNNTRLLVWEITESIEELSKHLTELNLTELESKATEKRKQEYLGVRVALKALLQKEIAIKYDTEGKPQLVDNSFQISVSHSGRWIAVVAHPTRVVGVDIEVPTDKIQKVHKRFLSETEQTELSDCLNINQLQLAWSAKEALYKIIGKEAIDFAKQLRIFPFDVQHEGEILAEHLPTKKQYKLQYIQQLAYTLVYCLS